MRDGWREVTLGDVLTLEYGRALPERARSGSGYPVYGSAGIVGWHSEAITPAGTAIIVGRKGTAGSVHWSDRPCWPIDTTYFARVIGSVAPEFALLLLQAADLPAVTAQTGVPGLNRDRAYAIPCRLPPLTEQRRIVDLLGAMDFVAQRAEGVVASTQTTLEAVSRAVCADLGSAPMVALADVADVVGGITKDAKRDAEANLVEVPYLRVANVQRGWLDLIDMASIKAPPIKVAALRLRAGDVLFNEGGDRDKLGRGWVWEGQLDPCIHQNHVLRARLIDAGFDPWFLSIWGNGPFGRVWFEENGSQTTNLASVSLTTLRRFPVPAIPMAEQRRIAVLHMALREASRAATGVRERASAARSTLLADLLSGEYSIPASYDRFLGGMQ